MFGQMARYYDLLYAGKDYRSEARQLVALAHRYGRSGGKSWLDVACGTGRHLEFLRRRYSVVGVDRSVDMLRIARRRLPRIALHLADMRTFRLPARFDVVTCLFSAIGHLRTEKDVQRAFANFARHVKPGGLVLVEPWIDPAEFHPRHVHLVSYRSPAAIVARAAFSSRKGDHSVIRYHYLVAERRRGIKHLQETDTGLLVARSVLLNAMRTAGLRARFLRRGLTSGRGLILGTKPLPMTPTGRGRAARTGRIRTGNGSLVRTRGR